MKLSQLTIKEFKKKSMKLLPYLRRLAKDDEVKDIWYRKIELEIGMSDIEIRRAKNDYNTLKWFDLIELCLDKHEDTFYSIVSLLKDIEKEEVGNLTLTELLETIAEIGEDEGFSRVFTLAKN